MGGAKNCPETPRQRMIGMMYLVLTAMLALNVSTDVLKAFKLVDDSLHTTMSTTEDSNKQMMNEFRFMRDDNPQKNGEWYDKAVELTQRSDSLFNYIQDFKYQIALKTDGSKADPEARKIIGNDNRDTSTQYALTKKPGDESTPAERLKNMLVEYREYLIGLDTARRSEYEITFDVTDKQEQGDKMISWEDQMFHDMPAGAAVTLMTKLQNDIRNSQNEMIHYLMTRTDAGDMRVNKLNAYVIPDSKYVIRGGKYKAKIIMAAVDSTQTPEYYVEGNRLGSDGIYEVVASGIGTKKYSGWISYADPATGEMKQLHFTDEYSVGEPSVTISNVELNTLYRGYDNKFSISVPGVSNDKVKVSVNGASVRQQGGLWIIRPNSGAKEVTISVSAEMDGKVQSMGSQKYNIKPLPTPQAYLKFGDAEYNGDKGVPRNAFLSPNSSIIASYGPDGILNINFKVVSFKANINGTITDSNGSKFSRDQLNRMEKLKKGAAVIIMGIRAQTPTGEEISLSAIPLTLN